MMNLFIGLPIIGLLIFIGILALFVWIWALVDCLKSEASGEYKLLWVLIIVFMNVFGAILYFVFAKEFDKNKGLKLKGKKGKYLTRSSENEVIGGVCGGIANYFSFDPAIVRILWIVFTIFVNGVGILLYIIAWVAIPSDKDAKEQKTTKNKTAGKKEKNSKPRKKRSAFLAIALSLFVFLLLFAFVAGFIYLGNYKYVSESHSTIKNFVVDVKSEINEKVVIEQIKKTHNYKSMNGYDLTLLGVVESDDEACVLSGRDPYGIRIYEAGCREFEHKFLIDSDTADGYFVNTLVSGGRILRMTFTPFNKNGFTPDESYLSEEVIECLPEQRDVDFCIELYNPVCGFEEYPLIGKGTQFSNSCFACMDSEIKYFVEGECQSK